MAIKPPDLLNRLPSVSELLEKPPIRALADRWNRSTVSASVRAFLDELQRDLRRRAADVQLPTVRELAERAARYVVSQQHQSLGTAVNATGRIWSGAWINRPLADAALERAVAVGREFVVEKSTSMGGPAVDVETLLCRLTGAQAAVAVHSYTGALWLALSTFAASREVLVARAEVGEVGTTDPLPRIATAAGTFLKEIGTINRTSAADYESAITLQVAAVLKLSTDGYRVVGETSAAQLDELVALTRDRELRLIDALGAAPIIDPPAAVQWPERSVRSSIASGVELAIVRGDGLIGGPDCGIVVGNRDVIRRLTDHPLFAAWRLDPVRSAALAATLECYDGTERSIDALPVWQFFNTSIDNLRNRAERMAPQLAQVPGVATAVPIETRSPISAAFASAGGWPSYGIALTAKDNSIQSLDHRFQSAPLSIRGRVEGDQLILDLRTVFPRQDKQLIDTLLGAPTSDLQ